MNILDEIKNSETFAKSVEKASTWGQTNFAEREKQIREKAIKEAERIDKILTVPIEKMNRPFTI